MVPKKISLWIAFHDVLLAISKLKGHIWRSRKRITYLQAISVALITHSDIFIYFETYYLFIWRHEHLQFPYIQHLHAPYEHVCLSFKIEDCFKDTCVCRRGWWGWRNTGRSQDCRRYPVEHSCNAGSKSRMPSCTDEASMINDIEHCMLRHSLHIYLHLIKHCSTIQVQMKNLKINIYLPIFLRREVCSGLLFTCKFKAYKKHAYTTLKLACKTRKTKDEASR